GETVGDLDGEVERLVERQGPGLRNDLLQVRRAGELEHDERAGAVGAAVQDRDDVLVAERRARERLALEPREAHRAEGQAGVHALDRDDALELAVEGSEHGRHAAGSDYLVEAVAPRELLSDDDRRAAGRRERLGRHAAAPSTYPRPPGVNRRPGRRLRFRGTFTMMPGSCLPGRAGAPQAQRLSKGVAWSPLSF